MQSIARRTLIFLLWLGVAPCASAQSGAYRYELLALLPEDFAVCVVLHDLRGNVARWQDSPWLKALHQSAPAQAFLDAPELKQLTRWHDEMQKHLDLDWPTLRDDILGDTLIFSYSPGAEGKPDDERGLLLLHVRNPQRLGRLIDRVNDAQTRSGELKKLVETQYKGSTYYRRDQGSKSQYYFVKDSLAAVTTKEDVLHAFLDRRATPAKNSPWTDRFKKANLESSLVTMCVNPRMLDAEVLHQRKKTDAIPSYWRAIQAIFLSVSVRDEAELRISLQADPLKLPDWAKSAFTQGTSPSSLWQRFPEQSILTLASKIDFAGAGDAVQMLMQEKDRKKLAADWQGSVGAIMRLDLFKDILPNVGPDWGVCVLPAKDAKHLPQVLFALAVKPGAKDPPVDQTLFKAVEIFASLPVIDHNLKNPDSIIRVESVKQGKVDVRFLANDKLFPPGFQPASALKDGFLLFATAPEAIERFRFHELKVDSKKGTPLLRVSASELARLLDQRREHILGSLTEGQQMTRDNAQKNLEGVIGLLGLFDHATLSQIGNAGQASWSIRLAPRKEATSRKR